MYEEPLTWWKYAYNSILNYYIKPYSWSHIVEHRRNYRKYKEACIQSLQRPNDTELKLDLQKYEDSLTILNIVIAREHARQELKNKNIERERQIIASSPSKDVSPQNILTNNDDGQSMPTNYSKSESQKSSTNVTENSSSSKVKLETTLKQIGEHVQYACSTSTILKTKNKYQKIFSNFVYI